MPNATDRTYKTDGVERGTLQRDLSWCKVCSLGLKAISSRELASRYEAGRLATKNKWQSWTLVQSTWAQNTFELSSIALCCQAHPRARDLEIALYLGRGYGYSLPLKIFGLRISGSIALVTGNYSNTIPAGWRKCRSLLFSHYMTLSRNTYMNREWLEIISWSFDFRESNLP